jgi:UDP-N-acetyl-D-galactosamine dehydrogenase
MISKKNIGVIEFGYVGLPLAVTFGQKFRTIGFDIKKGAIENYRKKVDLNGEVNEAGFETARCLSFMTDLIKPSADLIII